MKRAIAYALVFALCALPAFSQAAARLNAEGFALYQAGKYAQAIPLFEAAAKADPSYKRAWYNLACVRSIMLKDYRKYFPEIEEDPCSRWEIVDGNIKLCLDDLGRAIALDKSYAGKCLNDPDMAGIRGFSAFYLSIGWDFSNAALALAFLENVKTWSLLGEGVYDPVIDLDFLAGGRFEFRSYYLFPEGEHRSGGSRFVIEDKAGSVISLSFDDNPPGFAEIRFRVGKDGSLSVIKGQEALKEAWPFFDGRKFLPEYWNDCSA